MIFALVSQFHIYLLCLVWCFQPGERPKSNKCLFYVIVKSSRSFFSRSGNESMTRPGTRHISNITLSLLHLNMTSYTACITSDKGMKTFSLSPPSARKLKGVEWKMKKAATVWGHTDCPQMRIYFIILVSSQWHNSLMNADQGQSDHVSFIHITSGLSNIHRWARH